ncbi:MAG: 30S ribosomal protein S12 methylthiotransferase RimO [Endomicrobium sp.]|jgi:ribosomal protein S12 methylthiotransferase|nr:30S ribosomal protein S12 methylthiotransferase RimO [Endomicrobium sp.]
MQKIAIIALGCPKNTVEAEYLLGVFKNKYLAISDNLNEADIAVIHTCSFIKIAREESEKYIRRVLDVKKKTGLRVYVSGCLPQLLKEKMLVLFPDIDGFVGTGTLKNLPELIFNKNFNSFLLPPGGLNNSNYRLLSSNIPSTYLKIAEGCGHKCSFCIIPTLRGRYESRAIKSLTDEAKALANNGIKELILVAQDTTNYGKDIYGVFALDKLLTKLAKINGLKWIRLLYAYPSSITDKLLEVFKEYKNICNYMDIPIQHISKNILSAMRRPLSTVAIIEKIKNKLPDIVLRTSIITGFPGETKKDVNELIAFLNQGYFQYVGVFEYSNQKEADSSKLNQQVKAVVAKERRILIENTQYEIFKAKIDKIKGTTLDLLVEKCLSKDSKYHIKGRGYFQSPEIDGSITSTTNSPLIAGKFYKATIKCVRGYNIEASFLD